LRGTARGQKEGGVGRGRGMGKTDAAGRHLIHGRKKEGRESWVTLCKKRTQESPHDIYSGII